MNSAQIYYQSLTYWKSLGKYARSSTSKFPKFPRLNLAIR